MAAGVEVLTADADAEAVFAVFSLVAVETEAQEDVLNQIDEFDEVEARAGFHKGAAQFDHERLGHGTQATGLGWNGLGIGLHGILLGCLWG